MLKWDEIEESVFDYLHSNKHFTDVFGVLQDLCWCVKPWHFVVNHSYSNGVIATRDISSSRHDINWRLIDHKIRNCFMTGLFNWRNWNSISVISFDLHSTKHRCIAASRKCIKACSMWGLMEDSSAMLKSSFSVTPTPLCWWKFKSRMWSERSDRILGILSWVPMFRSIFLFYVRNGISKWALELLQQEVAS